VSTVLESADHAPQIKYGYLFTKLTFRSLSEQLKKVSCAICESTYKYRTFFTHNSQHNQPSTHRSTIETMSDGLGIIGRWPREPSNTITDAFPCLASVANEAVNFVVGLMKQPSRRNKNEVMAGSSCSSAQDVLRRGGQ
jgi:hypothetical protein